MVDLAEDQIRKIDLDLSHLLTGVLSGSILHNAAPLGEGTGLSLVADRTLDAAGRPLRFSVRFATDGQGRFQCRVPHGVYTLEWRRFRDNWPLVLRAASGAEVIPGESTEALFHFQTARLRLRLLDAAGAPLRGVTLLLGDAGEPHRHRLASTDHDGWTVAEVEAGLFEVRVPLPLASSDGVPYVLDTLSASMGATLTRELRLPPP